MERLLNFLDRISCCLKFTHIFVGHFEVRYVSVGQWDRSWGRISWRISDDERAQGYWECCQDLKGCGRWLRLNLSFSGADWWKQYLGMFRNGCDLDRILTWDRVHLALGSSAGSANDTWVSARISIFTILKALVVALFIYSNSCSSYFLSWSALVGIQKMDQCFALWERVSSLPPLRTDWSLNWSPLSIYTADTHGTAFD